MSFISDLIGGSAQASQENNAENWSKSVYGNEKTGLTNYMNNGAAASNAQSQLLGLSPMTAQTQTGFNNYLNSTGYNFMMQQGQNAITGNAAAKGILNSGATAKALTQYGQNVGSSYFNNYLQQLGGVSQQGQSAVTSLGQTGVGAGKNVNDAAAGVSQGYAGMAGSAGTSSGSNFLTDAGTALMSFF